MPIDRKRFLAGTLLALDSALAGRAVGAVGDSVEISAVLPFAGADRVRVEVTLSAGDAHALDGLELRGRIEPWPQTKGPALWEGSLGTAQAAQAVVTHEITGLKPALWDLLSPNLYLLIVTAVRGGATVAKREVRFGFRSFVTHDGQFFLNGRRIFLRGNSINAPGRGLDPTVTTDRVFAADYIRDLKSRNINLMRIGGDADVWMDTCDELGMLVFQGRYGAPPGSVRGISPPTDFDASIAAYKADYFSRYLRHPSIVIDILSNEMPAKSEVFAQYLDRAYHALQPWDPNRLYIDNAGFGHGRSGDINDQHPYDGWYGATFLGYYRYRTIPAKVQPITLSETVGAYTQSDGRFEIANKQLAAALTWTGHTTTPERDGYAYQAFLAGQIVESFRRLRSINPHLAGVMPFTDIFDHWTGVARFAQMHPKPVADQLRVSYQPVLLSWELWTTQVYAGSAIRPIAHIVNDADDGSDLPEGATLDVILTAAESDRNLLTVSLPLPAVPYYAAKSLPVPLTLPAGLPSGEYILFGHVKAGEKTISQNSVNLFIAAREEPVPIAMKTATAVYDPTGKTVAALAKLRIAATQVTDLSALSPGASLVIGEDAWAADSTHGDVLSAFITAGGRVLLLRQEPAAMAQSSAWLGVGVIFGATPSGMYINPERPTHPVFDGIPRERLRLWSDPTGWDQSQPGLPAITPVTMAFNVAKPADLKQAAILADFGRGLGTTALGEIFSGRGSVLICGFSIVARAGLDPIADRLLRNLIAYTANPEGHHAAPLIDSPIFWGVYATERGVVGSSHYGLLVNVGSDSESDQEDHSTTVGLSDTILFPRGRRPFGPFSYNGNCHIVDDNPDSPTGSGFFFAHLPDGRRLVTTTVRNPEKESGQLIVEVNGSAVAPLTVGGGKMVTFSTPLAGGATDVAIRYTGTKTLVLLKTEFT